MTSPEPEDPTGIPDPADLDRAPLIVVTGTSASVDTALVGAALLVSLRDEGLRVATVTAVRTDAADPSVGLPRLAKLAGCDVRQHPRLEPALPAPVSAPAAGLTLAPVAVHAARWARLCQEDATDVVLVDDAEGLATPIDADGATLLDLLALTADLGVRAGVVVATGTGRDDLRTAAVLSRLARAEGLEVLGLVIDRRPDFEDEPGRRNMSLLAELTGCPLLGVIPAGASGWDPQTFQDRAGAWLPVT